MPIREWDWEEPLVTIEGATLSFAQSMTLRVAVSAFLMQLEDPEHRAALGPIGDGYHARLMEIVRLMYSKTDGRAPDATEPKR